MYVRRINNSLLLFPHPPYPHRKNNAEYWTFHKILYASIYIWVLSALNASVIVVYVYVVCIYPRYTN